MIAGTLFVISVLSSNISTLLIALDRCMCLVIRGSFAKKGFSTKQMILSICICWCTAITLPTLATISSHYVADTTCVPIGGESASVVFSCIYVAIHSMLFLGTGCAYIAIMIKLAKDDDSINKSNSNKLYAIVRLGLLVVSNFIISMAVCIIAVLSITRVY